MLRSQVGYILFALLVSSFACLAGATPVGLKVEDKTGAAFPDVLVIVKSLSLDEKREVEIFRALTDAKGIVPSRELPTGLYRLIATCPYGICKTKVQEFYVKDDPVQLELTLDVVGSGTHGEGDVTEVGPSKQLKVRVTDSEGRPVRLASVIVRDSDVQHEGWYKTDSGGSATVDLPEGSVTVVVLYGGNLTSKTLSAATVDELTAKGTPLTIRLGAGQDASISVPVAPQDAPAHESNHVLAGSHGPSSETGD
jgi:Carboxypeptidase regulatory-like domain